MGYTRSTEFANGIMNGTENGDRASRFSQQQVTWIERCIGEEAIPASRFPYVDRRAGKRPCRVFLSRGGEHDISNTDTDWTHRRARATRDHTVPPDQQHRLHDLLVRNQAGVLTEWEYEQLAVLQQQADLVMLRKARAAALLRFRGKRVPTLAELSQLTATDA